MVIQKLEVMGFWHFLGFWMVGRWGKTKRNKRFFGFALTDKYRRRIIKNVSRRRKTKQQNANENNFCVYWVAKNCRSGHPCRWKTNQECILMGLLGDHSGALRPAKILNFDQYEALLWRLRKHEKGDWNVHHA